MPVNHGPFMEFMRLKVVMSAADTYDEQDFQTPASKTENLAMLIHQITVSTSTWTGAVEGDNMIMHIASTSETDTLNPDDPHLVGGAVFGKEIKLATNGMYIDRIHDTIYFDPPILYAKNKIYIGMNTVGQGAVKTGYAALGYTLEKVDKDSYIAALVED